MLFDISMFRLLPTQSYIPTSSPTDINANTANKQTVILVQTILAILYYLMFTRTSQSHLDNKGLCTLSWGCKVGSMSVVCYPAALTTVAINKSVCPCALRNDGARDSLRRRVSHAVYIWTIPSVPANQLHFCIAFGCLSITEVVRNSYRSQTVKN